jgi:hypothetical protein
LVLKGHPIPLHPFFPASLDPYDFAPWLNLNRDDRKRFVVRADEKLTAFVELEAQLADKGMAF